MQIAKKIKAQSVSAYIIYMYQVEDVIRAYGMDADRLAEDYLPRFGFSEDELAKEKEWYEALIRMMREEDVCQSGHVQVIKNTITLLSERHLELLHDPKQPFYSAAYYKALPSIVELRAKGEARDKSEIENCLDAVYGATVLRMRGVELTAETKAALAPVSHLLEMLDKLYAADTTDND